MPKKTNEWITGLIGGVEKRQIDIVAYRPVWVTEFMQHEEKIRNALGSVALCIEHIGSTSVPELAAKPVIDMLVVVDDPSKEDLYLPAMIECGYELRVREPDFEEHRMFRTPERDVHIHIFPKGSGEIERYLLFRDFLRFDSETRIKYETLKRKLSTLNWADMNEYADAKTSFIEDVIKTAKSVPTEKTAGSITHQP